MPPEVALSPEALKALRDLRRSVTGPYLIRLTGAVRRGNHLVEAECSCWRTEDGEDGLSIAPIPYGRTWPLPVQAAHADEAPAPAQRTYAQQRYDEAVESEIAATLTAHDGKEGPRTLVVVGDMDDVANEIGAPKPKRRAPVAKKGAAKKAATPKKRKTRRRKAGTKKTARRAAATSGSEG